MTSGGISGRRLPSLAAPKAAVVGAIVAGGFLVAPGARASSAPTLPPYAQGHAYRHGVVPRRGLQVQASSPSPPSNNLLFGGGTGGVGVTTGPPKVYLVFWGSQWGTQSLNQNADVTLAGDPSGMAPYLQAFMKGLGTGGETWSGVMTQYCEGVATGAETCPSSNTQHVGYPAGGALAGVWVDESSAAPQQATGNQLAAEAVSAAAYFGNTTSTSNRNVQYVIVSPHGTNPDGFNTRHSNFCAWHDYTADSTLSGGAVSSPYGPMAFTNLPYITDAGGSCGENFVNSGSAGTLDGVSIVEGHEFAETITDQFPTYPASGGGWINSGGSENGDLCAWISSGQGASQDITLTTGTFAVQSTWANDFNSGAGGCEISHPIVTNNDVTVNGPGDQNSTEGEPVSLQISTSDSSQTPSYAAFGLPSGLSISSSSGLISGTPSTTGSWTVTVYATDSTGASGTTTFGWTVMRTTTTTLSCSPSSVTAGSSTTCTATVSDTSSGTASTPTGTVNFSAFPTSEGTFSGAGTCTLSPTGTTGTASCQATYTPTAVGSQTIGAAYQGDSVESGSTSSTTLNVSAPPSPPVASTAPPPPSSAPPSSSNGTQASTSGTGTSSTTPTTTNSNSGTPAATHASVSCPAATGSLTGSTLGLIKLGMTRNQVRTAYRRSSATSSRYQDLFCLTPTGVRVGYPSPSLLDTLTSSLRKKLAGHVIWATTANRHYSFGAIRPGVKLATAKRAMATATRVVVGRVAWYFLTERSVTVLLQIEGGLVRELGIVSKQLTETAYVDSLLARSLS
jgi:Putative Ig domain